MAHTVMVTGADGFIGSHLTEELVKRGEKVRAFCLYNSFGSLGWIDTLPPEIRSEIDIFMGDAVSYTHLDELLKVLAGDGGCAVVQLNVDGLAVLHGNANHTVFSFSV